MFDDKIALINETIKDATNPKKLIIIIVVVGS